MKYKLACIALLRVNDRQAMGIDTTIVLDRLLLET